MYSPLYGKWQGNNRGIFSVRTYALSLLLFHSTLYTLLVSLGRRHAEGAELSQPSSFGAAS